MPQTIPASQLVAVTPGVIGAAGTGQDLSGLVLTNSVQAPVGSVVKLANTQAVQAYFGPASQEAAFAAVYFATPNNALLTPSGLNFAQYNTVAVAGYLRGVNVSGMSLAQLQALSGTITLTVDGTQRTSSAITLTSVTTFSQAASAIQTALGAGVVVTYDSLTGAFIITSSTTGAASGVSAVTASTGTIAAALGLTVATGAVVSLGAVAASPTSFVNALIGLSQNFGTFTTLGFEPSQTDKLAFAAINATLANNYIYVCWDSSNTAAAATPAPTSIGAQIIAAGYGGTEIIFDPNVGTQNVSTVAALFMSYVASLNFAQLNGRTTAAYRSGAGATPGVFTATAAQNLIANGYNFYGAYATAAAQFTFYQPGTITGPFLWADSYVNQVKLTSDCEASLFALLASARSIPYNAEGYGLIEAALADPIASAVNFGTIRAGVTLSQSQVAQVNALAGRQIDQTLTQRGWYLLVLPASAATRVARTSPPCTLFYTDGQSVQRINLAALEVQ